MVKALGRISAVVLFLCYIAATIVESNFWGNLLSPVVTLIAASSVFKNFYIKQKVKLLKTSGLLLALSIYVWAACDLLWAFFDFVLKIDPEQVELITYGYSMTNVLLVGAVFLYLCYEFRNWNGIQVLLDSIVITICVFVLIWVVFFDQSIRNIIEVQSDWSSSLSICLDVVLFILITIWYFSIRNGMIPLFLRITPGGVVLYIIADIGYYYQYFYNSYVPNSLLDASYLVAFVLMAVGGITKMERSSDNGKRVFNNVGGKGKGILLIIAPVFLILFKGIEPQYLLILISTIMFYFMISSYIQKNIYKEALLFKEKQLNGELEQRINDRTEELLQKNKELDYMLNQDLVTGLYNRRYFHFHLKEMISTLGETGRIALFYIDMNKYKMIKTMYGNYIADKVLFEMSKNLRKLTHNDDHSILATYGQDIFVFAKKVAYGYQEAIEISEEIIQLCSNLYQIEELEILVTLNIGCSIFPVDAKSEEELIKHADIAMSQARMLGFNKAMAFDSDLGNVIYQKNKIEIMLKKVNFQEDFMLYYQPQVNALDKSVIGFEALIRWKTKTGKFISPNEFIPIAEETGYIVPIGDWVMLQALSQLADWNKRSTMKFKIGINVSLKQLNGKQFIHRLKDEIERLSLRPEWIDIEITETIQLEENQEIRDIFEDIRNMGVSISIDDFGTGYSSLYYLKNLPIDRIKIAKPLIDRIDKDDFDYQIVKSVITISKVKKIKVIAEGVETLEQWTCLKNLECDEIQGYFFGKPMPKNEIEDKYIGR